MTDKIGLARQARQQPSSVEEIAWKYLRNERLGFKFRREQPILGYRVDFYCSEAKLAVEFDGEQHDSGSDAKRDAEIATLGIQVLRFSNRDFFMLDGNPPIDVFNLIRIKCEERTGRLGIPFEL